MAFMRKYDDAAKRKICLTTGKREFSLGAAPSSSSLESSSVPAYDASEVADSGLGFLLFAAAGGGDVPPSLLSPLRLCFFDGGLFDDFLVTFSLIDDADEEDLFAAAIFGALPPLTPFATRGLEESDVSPDD